ncbi:hypothetical protein [uncultured Tateyamaria sp.]|uniref:hypothetical protein n=1 Tax=uncultured Tateyamaria sp. TaxID=455651 RepID=UPI002630A8FC|nr:hypothetical protein [uncultured Tateyamaria sp.]
MRVSQIIAATACWLAPANIAASEDYHAVVISQTGDLGYAQANTASTALSAALQTCPACRNLDPSQYYRSGPIAMNFITLYCADAKPDSYVTRAYDRAFAVRAAYQKALRDGFFAAQCEVLEYNTQ